MAPSAAQGVTGGSGVSTSPFLGAHQLSKPEPVCAADSSLQTHPDPEGDSPARTYFLGNLTLSHPIHSCKQPQIMPPSASHNFNGFDITQEASDEP
jgi:hypothetical protein